MKWNEDCLRDYGDNIKHTNICIIGAPERRRDSHENLRVQGQRWGSWPYDFRPRALPILPPGTQALTATQVPAGTRLPLSRSTGPSVPGSLSGSYCSTLCYVMGSPCESQHAAWYLHGPREIDFALGLKVCCMVFPSPEDEVVGWYHWLNGHEFDQTPGYSEGQGSLACCSLRGRKELDTT